MLHHALLSRSILQKELISFDEFAAAASSLTNKDERLVWWYLLENKFDGDERRKKLAESEASLTKGVGSVA